MCCQVLVSFITVPAVVVVFGVVVVIEVVVASDKVQSFVESIIDSDTRALIRLDRSNRINSTTSG